MLRATVIEVAVEGIEGLLAAEEGGADRIELCASLLEGGLTPSAGVAIQALAVAKKPIHVMLRPRGGDFLYSEAEFACMLDDVSTFREIGVAGIVTGCLTSSGEIDEMRMTALAERAKPLSFNSHRAFDMTNDPFDALEALIRCGVERVLTSGQKATASDGADLIAALVDRAGGRIVVVGCGDLNPQNIADVLARTRVKEMHFIALKTTHSLISYRNKHITIRVEDLDRAYCHTVTDAELVSETIGAVHGAL